MSGVENRLLSLNITVGTLDTTIQELVHIIKGLNINSRFDELERRIIALENKECKCVSK